MIHTTSCDSHLPATAVDAPMSPQRETRKLDAQVKHVAKEHFDEFSAPEPLVATVLTAEAAGVARNGLAIATAFVHKTSSAGVGLGWAAAPFYCIAGIIMAAVGGILLPSCYADFKNAMKGDSMEEKWRSSLNLLDKCALTAIGVVLGFMGILMLAVLIGSAHAAVIALAGAALPIATIVFAVLLTVRGVEMMIRGGYGLWKASQFQKEFQDQCTTGNAARWLLGEKLKDPAALKNRIGEKALDALTDALAKVDLSQPIDEQFIQLGVYEPLMKSVDAGICEERLKQQLFLSIGTIMFVGGALSLIAIGLTHGAAVPAVVTALGVAGSCFSLSMEALWMPYDNPKWFKRLADRSYRKHEQEHPLPRFIPIPENTSATATYNKCK